MSWTNRCAIYDDIDNLRTAKNTKELTSRLIPILNKLAYSYVNGSAAILDIHQELRTNFINSPIDDNNQLK